MNNIKIILSLLFILPFSGCRQIFGDGKQPELIVQAPSESSHIIVTSPVHGSIWEKGDIIKIKWIAPRIEKIKIELYRKSDFKFTIAGDAENDGMYEWTIPNDLPISNHYLFKVSNQSDADIFQYSGRFAVQ